MHKIGPLKWNFRLWMTTVLIFDAQTDSIGKSTQISRSNPVNAKDIEIPPSPNKDREHRWTASLNPENILKFQKKSTQN